MTEDFTARYPDFGELSNAFERYKAAISTEPLPPPNALDQIFADAAYNVRIVRRVRLQWLLTFASLGVVTVALILLLSQGSQPIGTSPQTISPAAPTPQIHSVLGDTSKKGLTAPLHFAIPKQHTAPMPFPYSYVCPESDVRLKILDMQLADVTMFYRQKAANGDTTSIEAIHRWDAGIRTTNPDDYERKNVPGIGWVVAMKGRDVQAPGMSIGLTSDTLEADTRLKLCDMQLGDVVDFYRQKARAGDPTSIEAIKRWDRGIRLTNPQEFERKIIGGFWVVTHVGQHIRTPGMSIQLSCD